MLDYESCKDFIQKRADEINAERKAEKEEKENKFFNPIERIERKLDAIIDWINWNVKEGMVVGTGVSGRRYVFFENVPTIDIEDCEQKDKDSE